MAGASPGAAVAATLEAENSRLAAEVARLGAEVARLRDSEKMYRTSAEIDGRLVWATDDEGGVVALRMPFSAVTGMAERDALGAGWLEVVHPDDRPAVERLWRKAVAGGKLFDAEFRTRIADGSYRTMRSRAVPLRGADGRVRGWSGTTEDIEEERATEQARLEAEERLRESEEMHRITLDLTQQIVWAVEPDGTGLTLSERYQELTGMGAGEDARLSIHPDDRDRVTDSWTAALESGQPYRVECRLRMRDGGYRLFRVRAMPLRDERGRILRWYGISEDIHEQKQAEIARRDVEERYRLAAQATKDAVWDYDIANETVDWSENAAAMFGAGAPLGRTPLAWWTDHVHPEDRSAVIESLDKAIADGSTHWSSTYRFLREDGGYADILDRGFIIRDDSDKAVRAVGAMVDLTERHRAEAEIRRIEAELIHVSRLSAMGTMASTLAHELNQPLTAIGNFISGAKRLAEKGNGTSQAALIGALAAAESGALRAGEIVRRLRELVSRGTVSVAVENLPRMIEEAGVVAFVDAHALGVRPRIELDPAAQWVAADRIQIQQVLINLVRNAIEAMDGGAEREVAVSTHIVDGDMIEVRVADTGSGIAPEHIDSLFSQFMTTKSGGMGIGLPISRTIVEAHGGQIWAENRPQGGALFRFTLPRAQGGRV